jgi:hypothetical protein
MKRQILSQGHGFECCVDNGMKADDPLVENTKKRTEGGEQPFRTARKFRLPLAPISFFDRSQ